MTLFCHKSKKEIFKEIIFLFVSSAPYYIQLNLRNNASDDVILRWKLNGKTNEFEIPKGEKVDKIITVTGANRPKHIKFSAFRKSTKVSVTLNGKGLLLVSPTNDRAVANVLIGDGMIYLYFRTHLYPQYCIF